MRYNHVGAAMRLTGSHAIEIAQQLYACTELLVIGVLAAEHAAEPEIAAPVLGTRNYRSAAKPSEANTVVCVSASTTLMRARESCPAAEDAT